MRFRLRGILVLLAVVVTACGGAASVPEEPIATATVPEQQVVPALAAEDASATFEDDPDSAAQDGDGAAAESGSESPALDDPGATEAQSPAATVDDGTPDTSESEKQTDVPDWFQVELTDVSSGEALTVAGLRGKVVLVETMAIWCSNCLRQQQEVKALHEELGQEDGLVTLVLDIDPNEDTEDLRGYAARHGFDWTYVVAPREVAREIGQLYGDQFLNPPSTPMFIVDRDGTVHLLPFGRKTADDLMKAVKPFLSQGM